MTIKQQIRMLEKHMNNLFPNLNIHFYVSKVSKFLGVPFGIGFLVTKGSGIGFLEFQVFNPCCKNLVSHFCCEKDIFFRPWQNILFIRQMQLNSLLYRHDRPSFLANQNNNTDFLPALKLTIIIIISPTDQPELILPTAHTTKN